MVRIQFKVPLTPTLKVKEFLVSLSKDPLTVITPELLRIVKTLPGLVSKGTKNGRNYQYLIFPSAETESNLKQAHDTFCLSPPPPPQKNKMRKHCFQRLLGKLWLLCKRKRNEGIILLYSILLSFCTLFHTGAFKLKTKNSVTDQRRRIHNAIKWYQII